MFFLSFSLVFLLMISVMFKNKLCCLLFMEGLMIYILFFFFFFFQASSSFSGSLLILLCFLVLDSVFGLCLLMSHSRNTLMVNSLFFNF